MRHLPATHCHCGSPIPVNFTGCPECECSRGRSDCGKRYSVKPGDLVTRKYGDTDEILRVTSRAQDGRVYVTSWITPGLIPFKLEATSINVYHIHR